MQGNIATMPPSITPIRNPALMQGNIATMPPSVTPSRSPALMQVNIGLYIWRPEPTSKQYKDKDALDWPNVYKHYVLAS